MYGLAMEPTLSLSLPDDRVFPLTKSSPSLLSSSSSLLSLISPIVNLGLGVSYNAAGADEVEGMATTSVCVPTSKCRDGRSGCGRGDDGGRFFFLASLSVSEEEEDAGSG